MTKRDFWASVILFALFIPIFLYQDQAISSYFYEDGAFVDSFWVKAWFWFGAKAGLSIAISCLLVWCLSFYIKKWKRARFVAIYLF